MEPESKSIIDYFSEDPTTSNILGSILSYLDLNQVDALSLIKKDFTSSIVTARNDPLYWKQATEQFFGISLHNRRIDWKRVYLIINKEKFKNLADARRYAALKDDVPMMTIVLDAYRNHTDKEFRTMTTWALIIASLNRSWNVVNFLLDDGRVDSTTTGINLARSEEDELILSKPNTVLFKAIKADRLDIIKKLLLIPEVVRISNYNAILNSAIESGHHDIVKFLLDNTPVDPSVNGNQAFIEASGMIHYKGESLDPQMQIIDILLNDPRVDPAAQNNAAFISAVNFSDHLIVERLLEDDRIDPSDQDNEAVVSSALAGNYNTLKLLLSDPRVDPSSRNNEVLLSICGGVGGFDPYIVELLLSDPRVDPSAGDNCVLMYIIHEDNPLHEDMSKLADLILNHSEFDPTLGDIIINAAANGKYTIVEKLLKNPKTDPIVNQNQAIKLAIDQPIDEYMLKTISILFNDDRVNRTLDKSSKAKVVKILREN